MFETINHRMYNTFHELSEKRHNWFYFCWKQRRQTALCMHWYPNYVPRTNSEPHTAVCLLGESGGVVNSLDFHPASLKSLGQFYFKCLLSAVYWASQAGLLTPLTFTRHHSSPLADFTSSVYCLHKGRQWQWLHKVYSANCRGIFEAHSQNVSGNKQ